MVEWLSFVEACQIARVKCGMDNATVWSAVLRGDFRVGRVPDDADNEENRLFPDSARPPQLMPERDRQNLTIVHYQGLMDWLRSFAAGKATGVDGVPVVARTPVVPHRPKETGYVAADAPLVAEMHDLLSTNKYNSATKAAESMIDRIPGRNSDPKSKVDRLVRRYKKTYGGSGE